MSYPTDAQLTSWAQTLSQTNWTKLATRLANAIERDRRGGSAVPDGYPGAGGSGSGGHSGFVYEDPDTPPEFVPATSVELVALARSHARDEHHDRTRQATSYLEQAVQSLGALVSQLDRIEARAHNDTAPEPGCTNHAIHGIHADRYRGDSCEVCYRFKLEHGVFPPAKLIDDRARGIRWTTASVARALAEVCNR